MRALVLVAAALMIAVRAPIDAQSREATSGTIYYENGLEQRFSDIKSILIAFRGKYDPQTVRCFTRDAQPAPCLKLWYQNTDRTVPLSLLSEIDIRTWKALSGGVLIEESQIQVRTTTGAVAAISPNYQDFDVRGRYPRLVSVTITLVDDLTGEVADIDVQFLMGDRLNIRRIVLGERAR